MLKPKPDPLKDLLAIQQQINKLFEDRLQTGAGSSLPEASLPSMSRAGAWLPPVNAWETPTAFVVQIELPGVAPEDVTVSVERAERAMGSAKGGGTPSERGSIRLLTLRGERKKPAESGVRSFHRMEREHGTFVRAFTVPKGVSTFDVVSAWTDGVLQVTLSKIPEKSPSKKKK
jgi:HSP20 family protein